MTVETTEPLVFESFGGDDIFSVCTEMQEMADANGRRVECTSFNEFRLYAKPGGDGTWLGITAFAGRLQDREPVIAKSWHHPTDDDIVRVLTWQIAVLAQRFNMDTALEKTGGDWRKAWDMVWAQRGRGTDKDPQGED